MQAGDREKVGLQGLEVTRLGLGGTTFGNLYSALDEQEGLDVIDASYMAGVRYFDTAPLYGYGMSETKMGPGLARYNRDEIAISSKVGYVLKERQEGDDYVDLFVDAPKLTSYFDYSRDAVLRSIEGTLKRLKTDRLDIVLIHDPDDGKSIEPGWVPGDRANFDQVMAEAYPALAELREQGVVKAIGLGMNQWQMLADFARAGNFDAFLLAGRYTLLEQESLRELLPLCTEREVRIIIGGPYNSGILATGAIEGATYNYAAAPEPLLERVRGIEAVCARHDVPLQAAALQFPFGHSAVATVIPGARTVAEVEGNVGFLQHAISADFWAELKQEGLIDAASPTP
ncbi:MAG: aldo/keto reductase [Gemmatimonadetes bacterium]|jgi:D-threo-aldose 1-dehydrogenase|nr:aldo/keto reductase [Gemmatimonadota bacterium]MDE0963671.1 aldo/keto reductase [Candidatus Latescibacterota bacterium]MBT5328587.1 aldo/keto reductase [Gemmatimonadota bacterium]MBT5451598.1 aldo/keto reductase [Gemmatimonadota bacterium]MBT5805652.1 aldo/keto reductase [Gemmatimonadota bacterium]|tara:strand:+ start:172 stop:1200 length:1029 start_codon:yes stop_codon:yes gene_type:complete